MKPPPKAAQIADKVSGLDDTVSVAPDAADGGPMGAARA